MAVILIGRLLIKFSIFAIVIRRNVASAIYDRVDPVRRQNIWRRSERNLVEHRPRLGLILSG